MRAWHGCRAANGPWQISRPNETRLYYMGPEFTAFLSGADAGFDPTNNEEFLWVSKIQKLQTSSCRLRQALQRRPTCRRRSRSSFTSAAAMQARGSHRTLCRKSSSLTARRATLSTALSQRTVPHCPADVRAAYLSHHSGRLLIRQTHLCRIALHRDADFKGGDNGSTILSAGLYPHCANQRFTGPYPLCLPSNKCVFKGKELQNVTDASYRTIPTATGQLCYGREAGARCYRAAAA